MATVHLSEAEVARDLHAALAKVQQGVEIVIEQDHRPVAVLRAQHRSGRPITEILREVRQRNATVTLDEDCGKDPEQGYAVLTGNPRHFQRILTPNNALRLVQVLE